MEFETAQVVLVKDINPGTNNDDQNYSDNPGEFVEFNDRLDFSADDG